MISFLGRASRPLYLYLSLTDSLSHCAFGKLVGWIRLTTQPCLRFPPPPTMSTNPHPSPYPHLLPTPPHINTHTSRLRPISSLFINHPLYLIPQQLMMIFYVNKLEANCLIYYIVKTQPIFKIDVCTKNPSECVLSDWRQLIDLLISG